MRQRPVRTLLPRRVPMPPRLQVYLHLRPVDGLIARRLRVRLMHRHLVVRLLLRGFMVMETMVGRGMMSLLVLDRWDRSFMFYYYYYYWVYA